MKINKTAFLGCILVMFGVLGVIAEPLGEGWHLLTSAPSAGSPTAQPLSVEFGAMAAATAESSSSEIPLRIQELASALQTPENMFEFVYNTIDYVPSFGLLKGAERTLLDGAGTDADQADLLVQLLRSEGYTASFAYGKLDLPLHSAVDGYDVANWIGVASADAETALDLVGIGSSNGIDRVWVWVDTPGGSYDLDPAFKQYETPTGVDVNALSGLNLANLLSAAGGDLNGTAVSNLNENALADYLDTLSSNLATSVKSLHPNDEVDDLLGLRKIVKEEVVSLSGWQRYTPTSRTVNAELPSTYFHTMQLAYGSLDRTFGFHEISASDMTVYFAESATASSAPSGNPEPLMQSLSVPMSEGIELSGVVASPALRNAPSGSIWLTDDPVQGYATTASDPSRSFGEVYNRTPYHLSDLPPENIYQGSLTPSVTFVTNPGNAYKNLSYKSGNIFYLKLRLDGSGQSAGTKNGRIKITLGSQIIYINLSGSVIDVPTVNHGNVNETQFSTFTIRSQVSGATGQQLTVLNNTSGAYTAFFEGGQVKSKLDAAGQARGQKTAMLLYEFTYGGSDYEWIYDLTGFVRQSPNLNNSVTWDFGTKYAHELKQGTLVLKNSGSYTLQLTDMIPTGSDGGYYGIYDPSPVSIGSGSSRNITAIYHTASIGAHDDAYIGIKFTYDEISYDWNDFFPLSGETIANETLQLWQDDTLLEETYAVSGTDAQLTLTINHPYLDANGGDSGLGDQIVSYPIQTNGTYAILLGFGQGQYGGALKASQQRQAELVQSGEGNDTSRMIAQSLHVMGRAWLQESALNSMLSEVVSGSRMLWHHRVGMAAQEAGYYVDIKGQIVSGITAPGEDYLSMLALIPSAMEHGVLEQYQGSDRPAASTIKLLKLANDQGLQVFRLGADDFSGARSTLLAGGYSGSELDEMSNNTYLYGSVYILPEHRSIGITNGTWTGNGYIEKRPSSMAMIINGSYGSQNGGYSFIPGTANANLVFQVYEPDIPAPANLQSHRAADPVDMTSGFYVFDHADLSMSGPMPLVFSRHYSSGSVDHKSTMGHGWTHSYNVYAQEHSAYADSMGGRSYEDAVSAIVAHAAVRELTVNEDTPKGWMTAALTAQWAMDRLTDNAVSIYVGQKVITFIEQPDGSYTAPPGMTMSLGKSVVSGESYIMQERHGNTYIFDDNLNIERVEDPHSNTLSFVYNTQTNLETVTSSFGPEFTFGYAGDLLTSVTDNSSPTRSISYQYDSDNLTNFVDAATFSWGVGYDSEHRVKWMKDPEQVTTIQNFYNSIGQVTNQISSSGNDWDFFFTGTRNVSEDPLGNQTAYYLDSKDRTWSVEHPNEARSYSVFDGQNHVIESVAPNNVTNAFVYDVDHNLLATTNAVGVPEQVVSKFGYDAEHHLRFVTNAVATAEQTISEYTYTTEHKVDTITVAKGTALARLTDYNYNSDGLVEQISEGNGQRITTYNYDSNSQYGHPKTISSTDAGDVVTIYNKQGNLKSQTVDGKTTEFNYDNRRLQTGTTYAKSTADEFSTSQTYWKNGLLKTSNDGLSKITHHYWTTAYKQAGVVFPNTGSTTNIYDEVDRLVMSRDAEGNWATNTLNEVGLVVALDSAYSSVTNQFDVIGNLTNSIVDPDGFNLWTTSTFDTLGRNTSVETALSEVETQYDYLNRATNVVDAASKDWKTEYDELGRVKKTFRPSGNYEEVGYDALGNRTAFWNAEFKPMNFGIDARGRVTSITNALSKVTSFGYTDSGNLEWKRTADTKLTQYGYDSLNRLTAITNQGVEIATFDHDNNGNTLLASDADTSVSFGYDGMNRMTASTQTVNGVSVESGYGYDLNGNRTNIVYPGGLTVNYSIGDDNRLESVTTKYSGNTKTVSFGYDAANRLDSISYPNGVNSSLGQDAEGRITSIAHGTFVDRTIQRNALGFKQTELIDAGLKPTAPETGRRIKSHNDADQLTAEWVQQGTNELNISYAYNDNGGLFQTSEDGTPETQYGYDYADRLESVSLSADIEYLYDASGARVGRSDGTTTNYFVVDYTDGLKRPLAETDSSGIVTRYYVWSGASLICHIEADGTTRYYHSNELGSTLALTDESGNVTDQFAYMPYGYATHTAYAGSSDTPFQWLGGYGVYYDADTDLHLTLHRAYSSKQKRFISSDPLGIDGGVNVYAMANRNPLAFVDPYGLSGLESSGGIGGQTYLSAARGGSVPWEDYEADHRMRSMRALADQPLLLGSSFTGYSDFGHNMAVNNAIDYVTAIPSAVVGEWAWGKAAGIFSKAPNSTAYRAIDPKFAQSTLDDGFYRSGAAGRLGNDGIYANSSVRGAITEFQYHNPGVKPTVFEVNYPAGSTLNVSPPTGNFYIESPLPFTQSANVLTAPSLRQSGTINYLIRNGATPGGIVQ